jgi:hypothetical protein
MRPDSNVTAAQRVSGARMPSGLYRVLVALGRNADCASPARIPPRPRGPLSP